VQVSGLKFTYNVNEDVGMRVVNAWVQLPQPTPLKRAAPTLAWVLVDPERDYTISTISYVANGGDGYTVLAANAQDVQTSVLTAENVPTPPLIFVDMGTRLTRIRCTGEDLPRGPSRDSARA
jgi:hypothetical protein